MAGRHWVGINGTAGDIWEGLHDFLRKYSNLQAKVKLFHDPIATFSKKIPTYTVSSKTQLQFSELKPRKKLSKSLPMV